MSRGHNLPSDLEHRDVKSDLKDVECGKFLDALQKLPQNLRMLMEDSDMHVELDDQGNLVKIIRKRSPEFLKDREMTVVTDAFGNRISVPSDEELNLSSNPEDVYNQEDVEFVQADMAAEDDDADFGVDEDPIGTVYTTTEHVAPMDRWDVIFDATAFSQYFTRLNEVAQFLHSSLADYRKRVSEIVMPSRQEKLDILNEMFNGEFVLSMSFAEEAFDYLHMSQAQRGDFLKAKMDELIYSSDWFPSRQDKRLRSSYAKELAGKLENMTRQQLAAALADQQDQRPVVAAKARAFALTAPLGKAKAVAFARAHAASKSYQLDVRANRSFTFADKELEREDITRWEIKQLITKSQATLIHAYEKRILWDMWRTAQALKGEQVPAPVWMFQRMLSGKLYRQIQQGLITREEATNKLQTLATKIYNLREDEASQLKLIEPEFKNKKSQFEIDNNL